MGTGAKSGHQAYDVAPTAGTSPAGGGGAPGPEGPAFDLPDTLAQVQAVTGQSDTDLADTYEQLAKLATGSFETFGTAMNGEHSAALSDVHEQAHAQTLAWLQQLTPEQLQQLAAANGFTHPELVGLSGKQPHPLVHVLDPFYPDGIASKVKIQDVANARYAALAAGETINGLTLADLHPPAPTVPADGQWTATVSEVAGLQAQIATTLADVAIAPKHGALDYDTATALDTGFAELIALENKLATAVCPDDPQALATAQAAAAHSITQALEHGTLKPGVALQLRQDLATGGTLTSAEAGVLSTGQIIAVARPGTSADERAQLLQLAGDRAGQLAAHKTLTEQHAQLIGKTFSPSDQDHWASLDPATLSTLATLTGELHSTEQGIKGWANHKFVPVTSGEYSSVWAEAYTQHFRQWAKTQPLAALRQSASELGLEHAGKASRAQVQNFIAGQWDPALSQHELQAAVTTKATAPPPAPAAPAAAAPAGSWTVADLAKPAATAPGAAVKKPAGTAPVIVKGSGWAAEHANLISALKHAAASTSGLPARLDNKAVAAWDFGKGQHAGHLGGTHAKSLHTGPDGNPWMFKNDSSGGARAAAEADAAAVFAAGGLPAVPVYRATVGGKTGSVQPLVTQASHFPATPSSWSQADVDAIVRYHVGAWATSNHDGHEENLLRTPAGGMLAIDLGQAGKFCDRDKLSLSYNPVGNTVTHTLYNAHLNGSLAPGVTVNPAAAHPVLAAYEKIPDAQWRSMLHDTAYSGAKAGVSWTSGMRKRAAKTHGIAVDKVSDAQVAEAFLDAAVERKSGLRKSFAAFYAGELKLAAATALLHGGH
jgi:hypothetical protein